MLWNKRKREIAMAAAALLILADEEQKKREKRKRRIWVHPWLEKRPVDGAHQSILQEFRTVDQQKYMFKHFLRVDLGTFNHLLELVTPLIQKIDTNMRQSISASERLAVTLRFLATGDSYKSLSVLFRIAACTITHIVPEVCDAIYAVLKNKHMKVSDCDLESVISILKR